MNLLADFRRANDFQSCKWCLQYYNLNSTLVKGKHGTQNFWRKLRLAILSCNNFSNIPVVQKGKRYWEFCKSGQITLTSWPD